MPLILGNLPAILTIFIVILGAVIALLDIDRHKMMKERKQHKADFDLTTSKFLTLQAELQTEKEKNAEYKGHLSYYKELQESYNALQNRNVQLEKEKTSHITQVEELKKQENLLHEKFDHLARKILEENSKKLNEASTLELGKVLNPFKEKITEFQTQVQQVYVNEREQRTSLKDEINKMVKMQNDTLSTAEGLTKALKGDNKAQGNWGEIQLERILEESGLKKGRDYILQGEGLGLMDDEGNRQQPDVIINLPDQQQIIIDAKVNLVHYDAYINSNEDEEKDYYIKEFIKAIKMQIDNLSNKAYHHNRKLQTVDFTIMFMPIESAYMVAIDADPTLHQYAWNKKIVLCNPGVLFAMLKTVAYSIGNNEREKNYDKIIDNVVNLYDKFVGFAEDMVKIGDNLEKSKQSYDAAFNKLKSGSGNLVNRVLTIQKDAEADKKRKLKKMPSKLLEEDEPTTEQNLLL